MTYKFGPCDEFGKRQVCMVYNGNCKGGESISHVCVRPTLNDIGKCLPISLSKTLGFPKTQLN